MRAGWGAWDVWLFICGVRVTRVLFEVLLTLALVAWDGSAYTSLTGDISMCVCFVCAALALRSTILVFLAECKVWASFFWPDSCHVTWWTGFLWIWDGSSFGCPYIGAMKVVVAFRRAAGAHNSAWVLFFNVVATISGEMASGVLIERFASSLINRH